MQLRKEKKRKKAGAGRKTVSSGVGVLHLKYLQDLWVDG